MANGLSRTKRGEKLDVTDRVYLLEDDLDSLESNVTTAIDRLKKAVEDGNDKMRGAVNKLLWAVITLLSAVIATLVGVKI